MSQTNGVDYGIHAIAFATALVHGRDPVHSHFDNTCLRDHLLSGLERGHVDRFPETPRQRRVGFGRKGVT